MSSSFLPETSGTLRVGHGYAWSELAWAEIPPSLPRPTPTRVIEVGYEIIGLDYACIQDRRKVKASRATYKPVIVMACVPLLINVCRHSGFEAMQMLGFNRHLVRGDEILNLLTSAATKHLTRAVRDRLIPELELSAGSQTNREQLA